MQAVATKNVLLEKITSSLGELPASPVVVHAVLGLTSNLNSNIEELSKVLAADPALTAKILRLSNSTFYGRSRAVSSLKEAILILGYYTLRSMAVATSTHSLYKKKGNPQSSQNLWDHSLACALACRLVATRIRHPQAEEIFIVGLLHDFGKMIMSQKLGLAYDEVIKEVEAHDRRFVDVENEKIGYTHTDVGELILQKWNLPASLVIGVSHHHSPEPWEPGEGSASIATVVHFCNQLAKYIGVGFRDFREPELSNIPFAESVGLTREAIAVMIEELKMHYLEEKKLFEEN